MSSRDPASGFIRLPLLDRLIDDDPQSSREAPLSEPQKLRLVQQAVRRDLQDLLNTRYRCVAWPPELNELDDSLINYGIPDFTAASLNIAADTSILIDAIQKAIVLFEPRLQQVQLEPVLKDFYVDRTFRFRIRAMLVIEGQQHRVQFDSAMESSTGQFDVD
jgi:type VI secretion system protein ImpF